MNPTIIDHERELLEAIALHYDQADAPLVIAKGEGSLASEIIAMGKKYGIHLHEDPGLMQQLSSLDVGERIPEQLYQVIAEIISFVYMLEGKMPLGWTAGESTFD